MLKLLLLLSVCVRIYQCLDGSQRFEEASQQMSPPLISQQTQAGLGESFFCHAQLSTCVVDREIEGKINKSVVT